MAELYKGKAGTINLIGLKFIKKKQIVHKCKYFLYIFLYKNYKKNNDLYKMNFNCCRNCLLFVYKKIYCCSYKMFFPFT